MDISKISKFSMYEILQLAALILIPLGLFMVYPSDGIAETGYGELLASMSYLNSIGSLASIKLLGLVFVMLSVLGVYFALSKLNDNNVAFLIALLLALSPLMASNAVFSFSFAAIFSLLLFSMALLLYAYLKDSARYAALLPALIGFFLLVQGINLGGITFLSITNAASSLGFVLPLSFIFIAFAELRTDKMLVPFALGILAIPLFAPFSLILFSFYTALGISSLQKDLSNNNAWLLLSFFMVVYLGMNMLFTPTVILAIAAFVAVILYFLFSLRVVSAKGMMVFSIFFILACASSLSFISLEKAVYSVPQSDTIAMFKFAKDINGAVAVFDFQNAFIFYSGKQAVVLTQEQLLSSEKPNAEYVAMSAESFYQAFANRSIALKFFGTNPNMEENKHNTLFGNKAYALSLALTQQDGKYSILAEPQPILFDTKSSYSKAVPFSKLRSFSSTLSLINEKNVLVNLDPLGDSVLYTLFTKCNAVYESDSAKIFKVC